MNNLQENFDKLKQAAILNHKKGSMQLEYSANDDKVWVKDTRQIKEAYSISPTDKAMITTTITYFRL